jgi:N-carbamoyl-L-amino-acid hydrolase
MAKIGATPGGGVQRLTLTDEDKQARDLYVSWLKELNLEVTIDEMGNIFGNTSTPSPKVAASTAFWA